VIGIGTIGELLQDIVVVFDIKTFKEPDFSLPYGSRESHAGNQAVESQALGELKRGKEIRGGEVKMVVADPGGNTQHAAGSFAVFGRNATVFDIDQANGIGTDTQEQQTIGRLRDVEPVE